MRHELRDIMYSTNTSQDYLSGYVFSSVFRSLESSGEPCVDAVEAGDLVRLHLGHQTAPGIFYGPEFWVQDRACGFE